MLAAGITSAVLAKDATTAVAACAAVALLAAQLGLRRINEDPLCVALLLALAAAVPEGLSALSA